MFQRADFSRYGHGRSQWPAEDVTGHQLFSQQGPCCVTDTYCARVCLVRFSEGRGNQGRPPEPPRAAGRRHGATHVRRGDPRAPHTPTAPREPLHANERARERDRHTPRGCSTIAARTPAGTGRAPRMVRTSPRTAAPSSAPDTHARPKAGLRPPSKRPLWPAEEGRSARNGGGAATPHQRVHLRERRGQARMSGG